MSKKRKRVRYVTKEKLDKVNKKNKMLYKSYQTSRLASNNDVRDTTYKVYQSYMNQFLVYLMEYWDNIDLYSEEFQDMAIEIMEGFMVFCQEELGNNKKVINTKLSAVSSFFHWSVRRNRVSHHPFDGKLERMQGAKDEKIIAEHFLTKEEVETITKTLEEREGYDIIDQLIWNIMMDSANRVGAIEKLTLSSLDLENGMFVNIREKRGKMVEVAFSDYTKEIIEEYLELRKQEMDELENDAFFITKYNGEWNQMSKNAIQSRIKQIGFILDIDDFRSHSIRKTALNLAHELTGDLALVAELANHNSIETTQQSYIRPRSKAEIRAELDKIRKSKGE